MVDKVLCINCKNHIRLEPDTPRRDVWYNQRCWKHLMSELMQVDRFDCIHGLSDHAWDYCRNHNRDGRCEDYEER